MQSNVNKRTTPVAVMIGIAISLFLATAFTAVITTLIANRTITADVQAYIIPVIHAVSIYIGGIIGKLLCSNKRFITEAICGAGYLLVLVVMNLLFSENGMHRIVSTLLGVIVGVICAGFTWNPSSNRGLKGRRKVRFR